MLTGPVRTAMRRTAARPNGAIRGSAAANVALREPDSRGERRRRAVEDRGPSEAGRSVRHATGPCGRGTERNGDPDGRCHGAYQRESHDACRPSRHLARFPRPRAQRPLGLRLRGFRTVPKTEKQSRRVGSLRRRGRCGRSRRLRGLAVGNARAGGQLVAAPRLVTPGTRNGSLRRRRRVNRLRSLCAALGAGVGSAWRQSRARARSREIAG